MQSIAQLKNNQRGLSMIGFLFVAVVLIFVAMLAMKLVPAYIEFFSVKKILAAMGQDSSLRSKSNAEIRSDFSKRADASYVEAVQSSDLTIERSSAGTVVSAEYEFRTKLLGNASLVVDFSARSDGAGNTAQIE
jgi:Tfp pilus assembly protein PilV